MKLLSILAAAFPAADLAPGHPAPSFEAKADDGRLVRLADFKGRTLVLYFYPKDDTPGCTVEAQGFRDESAALEKLGVAVIGVSNDSAESHLAFKEKYKLRFPLLVDDGSIAKAYGVPVRLGYTARQTFVVGPDGKLLHVFRKVDPRGHAQELVRLLSPNAPPSWAEPPRGDPAQQ